MPSKRALERARALVGTPFRAQGRRVEDGLDCIGVAILAFGLERDKLPDDYRISGVARSAEFRATLDRLFRNVGRGRPGNLVLMRVGPQQLHLGIISEHGLIHADARRKRVIEGPFPEGARIIGAYRLRRRPSNKGK